jgi:RND family efflux transporter MFP subunit
MPNIKNHISGIFRFFLRNKILLLPLIAVIVGLIFFINSRNKAPTLETVQVQRGNVKATVSASGSLTGKNTVDLKFKSGGKLASLAFKAGDSIEKGQQVASLDVQQLSIDLQQAQNTLRDKQATVDKVINDIHLSQYGNGGFSNIGTANETETQKQTRVAAEAARDSAVDTVKEAGTALQDAVIFAPISGVVTKADPIPGQNVAVTDLIAQIVDDSEIKFNADVDEGDISKVSVGQQVDFTLNAYPDRTFMGVVEQITPTTKTTTSGATVVPVKIGFNAAGINFVAGLNGDVNIITSQAQNVLVIPSESLKEDNTVIVKKGNGSLEQRPVEPGVRSDTQVEIKSGLYEGERVVTNPPAQLPQSGGGFRLRFF